MSSQNNRISPFRVFPTEGYLNSQYTIIPNIGDIDIQLFHNGQLISQQPISNGMEHVIFNGFSEPGIYEFKYGDFNQAISVDDAYRYGDGALENVVAFDGLDEVFILMSDRFHIFSIEKNKVIFTQNRFSAKDVIRVGQSIFLLKSSADSSDKEYEFTAFCLSSHSILGAGTGELLHFEKENNLIFLKHEDNLSIFDSATMSLLSSYVGHIGFHRPETCFYIFNPQSNEQVIRIDGVTGSASAKSISNLLGVTPEGVLIQRIEKTLYLRPFVGEAAESARIELPSDTDEFLIDNCMPSVHVSLATDNCFLRQNNLSADYFVQNPGSQIHLWKRLSYSIYPDLESDGLAFEETMDETLAERNKVLNSSSPIRTVNKRTSVTKRFLFQDPSKTITLPMKHLSYERYGALINYDERNGNIYPKAFLCDPREGKAMYDNVEITSSPYGIITVKKCSDKRKELSFFNGKRRITVTTESSPEFRLHYDGRIIEYKPVSLSNVLFYDLEKQTSLSYPANAQVEYRKEDCAVYSCSKGKEVQFWSGIKYLIPGNPSIYSVCRDKSILNINGKILICNPADKTESFIRQIDFDFENNYKKAQMAPDGRHLAFSKDGKTFSYYDIENNQEVQFGRMRFVRFTADGKAICADSKDNNRSIHILDPDTMSVVSSRDYKYYCFSSPDGTIIAETGVKHRYFLKPSDSEVQKSEYEKQSVLLGMRYGIAFSSFTPSDQEKTANRERLYKEYQQFLKDNNVTEKDLRVEDLYKDQSYVVIRRLSDGKCLELPINPLNFLNYVAISTDNRYVGIVGKPSNSGYIHIFKISKDFDSFSSMYCSMIAQYATWSCGFASNGLFGTSDSAPATYITNVFDDSIKQPKKFLGRSWLCFSRSGKYAALSRQGYRAISAGGCGHIPSNKTFIFDTETNAIIAEYCDHSKFIKVGSLNEDDKNIVMASFSDDERRLMTIGSDGVIIVRNLHLG